MVVVSYVESNMFFQCNMEMYDLKRKRLDIHLQIRFLRLACLPYRKPEAKAKICLQQLITARLCSNIVMEAVSKH